MNCSQFVYFVGNDENVTEVNQIQIQIHAKEAVTTVPQAYTSFTTLYLHCYIDEVLNQFGYKLTWKTLVILSRRSSFFTSSSSADLASLRAPPRLLWLLDSLMIDFKSKSD